MFVMMFCIPGGLGCNGNCGAKMYELVLRIALGHAAVIAAVLLAGCARYDAPQSRQERQADWLLGISPVAVTMEHVAGLTPHDSKALTQGLYYRAGEFIESTGGEGRSSIRRIDARSGEIKVIRKLPARFYGEGCAPTPQGIVQLTWRNGVAFRYDEDNLNLLSSRSYPREGWGLIYDGTNLVASDGSDKLYVLNSITLETECVVLVRTPGGKPVKRLNEMAWVGGLVLANVFLTDLVVAIDMETGLVRRIWDLSEIARNESPSDPEHVLNGIAHDPETGRLWITGKGWSNIYEVRLPDWPG